MYKNAIKKSLAYVRPFLIGRLIYEKRYVSNDLSAAKAQQFPSCP